MRYRVNILQRKAMRSRQVIKIEYETFWGKPKFLTVAGDYSWYQYPSGAEIPWDLHKAISQELRRIDYEAHELGLGHDPLRTSVYDR